MFAIAYGGDNISKKYNLIGKRFGKLVVKEKTINPNNKKKCIYWLCNCDCGNECVEKQKI